MTVSATRLGPRLRRVLARADDGELPIAELNRRIGVEAGRLGLVRPSYEHVRLAVHRQRSRRETRPIRLVVEIRIRRRRRIFDRLRRHRSRDEAPCSRHVTLCYLSVAPGEGRGPPGARDRYR